MNSIHSKRSLALLMAATFAFALASAQAEPGGDAYSDATVFQTGPVVQATNAAATLETNEPLPVGFTSETYDGSLWWKWTPIFSGWYEITTEGSSIDTVLSVWTGVGNDLTTPKYMVHANDDAGAGGVSRIQIFANEQTEYRIAVAGRGPAQKGAIRLTAFYIPDPFAKLVAVQFVHSSVDVTSASASVTATLTLEASREIESGTLSIFTPGGFTQAAVSLTGANRISGNVAHGVYQVAFSLPRYIEPGSYRWNVQLANNQVNKVASHGTEAFSPLAYGMTQAVEVSNDGMVDAFVLWRSHGLQQGVDAASLTLDRFAFGTGSGQEASVPMAAGGGTLVRSGIPNIEVVGDAGGTKRLRVQFTRRLNAAQDGLQYTVQFSDDLKNWITATQPAQWLASNSTYEAVQVSDSVTTSDATHRFARVLVESLLQAP